MFLSMRRERLWKDHHHCYCNLSGQRVGPDESKRPRSPTLANYTPEGENDLKRAYSLSQDMMDNLDLAANAEPANGYDVGSSKKDAKERQGGSPRGLSDAKREHLYETVEFNPTENKYGMLPPMYIRQQFTMHVDNFSISLKTLNGGNVVMSLSHTCVHMDKLVECEKLDLYVEDVSVQNISNRREEEICRFSRQSIRRDWGWKPSLRLMINGDSRLRFTLRTYLDWLEKNRIGIVNFEFLEGIQEMRKRKSSVPLKEMKQLAQAMRLVYHGKGGKQQQQQHLHAGHEQLRKKRGGLVAEHGGGGKMSQTFSEMDEKLKQLKLYPVDNPIDYLFGSIEHILYGIQDINFQLFLNERWSPGFEIVAQNTRKQKRRRLMAIKKQSIVCHIERHNHVDLHRPQTKSDQQSGTDALASAASLQVMPLILGSSGIALFSAQTVASAAQFAVFESIASASVKKPGLSDRAPASAALRPPADLIVRMAVAPVLFTIKPETVQRTSGFFMRHEKTFESKTRKPDPERKEKLENAQQLNQSHKEKVREMGEFKTSDIDELKMRPRKLELDISLSKFTAELPQGEEFAADSSSLSSADMLKLRFQMQSLRIISGSCVGLDERDANHAREAIDPELQKSAEYDNFHIQLRSALEESAGAMRAQKPSLTIALVSAAAKRNSAKVKIQTALHLFSGDLWTYMSRVKNHPSWPRKILSGSLPDVRVAVNAKHLKGAVHWATSWKLSLLKSGVFKRGTKTQRRRMRRGTSAGSTTQLREVSDRSTAQPSKVNAALQKKHRVGARHRRGRGANLELDKVNTLGGHNASSSSSSSSSKAQAQKEMDGSVVSGEVPYLTHKGHECSYPGCSCHIFRVDEDAWSFKDHWKGGKVTSYSAACVCGHAHLWHARMQLAKNGTAKDRGPGAQHDLLKRKDKVQCFTLGKLLAVVDMQGVRDSSMHASKLSQKQKGVEPYANSKSRTKDQHVEGLELLLHSLCFQTLNMTYDIEQTISVSKVRVMDNFSAFSPAGEAASSLYPHAIAIGALHGGGKGHQNKVENGLVATLRRHKLRKLAVDDNINQSVKLSIPAYRICMRHDTAMALLAVFADVRPAISDMNEMLPPDATEGVDSVPSAPRHANGRDRHNYGTSSVNLLAKDRPHEGAAFANIVMAVEEKERERPPSQYVREDKTHESDLVTRLKFRVHAVDGTMEYAVFSFMAASLRLQEFDATMIDMDAGSMARSSRRRSAGHRVSYERSRRLDISVKNLSYSGDVVIDRNGPLKDVHFSTKIVLERPNITLKQLDRTSSETNPEVHATASASNIRVLTQRWTSVATREHESSVLREMLKLRQLKCNVNMSPSRDLKKIDISIQSLDVQCDPISAACSARYAYSLKRIQKESQSILTGADETEGLWVDVDGGGAAASNGGHEESMEARQEYPQTA